VASPFFVPERGRRSLWNRLSTAWSTRRASAEPSGARTDTQSPSPWLLDWAQGGRRSSAGVHVSPHGSLALAAYYACLRVIAEDCAKLPLQVLEHLERGRRKAVEHWLWPILHDQFNDDMTAITGREVMTHHVVGWGNTYGYIMRDRSMTRRDGQPVGIYPLHPARVRPQRDPQTGQIVYRVYRHLTEPDAREIPEIVPARDMIHLKGLGPDGLIGYSIAQIAAESLGLSLAAQRYGASFFGNSATPSGVLKHPMTLSEEAQKHLKASHLEQHGGPDASQGLMILEEGMEWQSIAIPPEQAQFLETRQFQVREVCRWFRMQPHKIGDLTDAHHTNIESQNIEHVTDTMLPWYVKWEQEINRKLLAGTSYYTKHDVRGLLRGDSAARAAYYQTMFMIAAYSPNMILELEDDNPYEGGDERFLQIQYAPVQQIVDGTARRQARLPERPRSPADAATQTHGHRPWLEEQDYAY
jgi:HK97 family phage portal protein